MHQTNISESVLPWHYGNLGDYGDIFRVNGRRVLVLAAGLGRRLGMHGKNRPKCLVSLVGKPILMRQLEVYEALGIQDINLVGGHRAEELEVFGYPVFRNIEYADTNMVWSMMCAEQLFDGTHDLIVSYGDIVFEPRVLESLMNAKGEIVVAADSAWERLWRLRMDDPLADAETFKIAPNGQLLELGKKPAGFGDIEGQYMGLIKFSADAQKVVVEYYRRLEQVWESDAHFRNMYMTEFIQYLIDEDIVVNVAWTKGGWLEVDTLHDLEVYNRLEKLGELGDICLLT